MSRKIKLLVVASVLLNVLLGGIVLGHIWHRMPFDGPSHKQALLEQLTPERQEEFRTMMEQMREESSAAWDEMRAVREKTMELLRAETFDAAAYQKQVDLLNAMSIQRKQAMAEGIKELAKRWSPEEREVLAKLMRRPPHSPRHGKNGPPPEHSR